MLIVLHIVISLNLKFWYILSLSNLGGSVFPFLYNHMKL